MSWVQDVWKLLETVATLTKELERVTTEVKELRQDVNSLTLIVTELRSELAHEKQTTQLVLEGQTKDIEHIRQSLDAKFQVLTSKLDLTVQSFEHRLNGPDKQVARPAFPTKND